MSNLCLLDPKEKFCYVPIEKNAQAKICSLLIHYDWKCINYDDITCDKNNLTHIIILRDPYERILSQLLKTFQSNFSQDEYLILENSKYIRDFCEIFLWCITNNSYQYLKQNISLQHEVVDKFKNFNITYFWLNPKFGYQINKWFQSENLIIPFNNLIVNCTNKNKIDYQCLQEFFYNYKNNKFKEMVFEFLKKDYELISNVDFFVKK